MPEDTPTQPAAVPLSPAVSPTGKAVISQLLTRVALGVFGVAGAIAVAPAAGIDMSFLPAWLPKVCVFVAFIAANMGFAGPGVRKAAPMALLVLSVGLSACKTVEPIVITGDSIVATGKTFEATAAVLNSLHASHAITETQYAGWYTFALRFKASFHAARLLYDAAADAGDVSTQDIAAGIITRFVAELGEFEALATQVVNPDGGAL